MLEDIPRKKQIRKVPIPVVLKEYINEYMIPGRMLIRNKDGLMIDPRTLENKMLRIMDAFGLSHDEICTLLGISEDMYNEMENGRHGMTWDQYLALLFIFHYNGRTNDVVDSLGLFPLSLKEKIKLA